MDESEKSKYVSLNKLEMVKCATIGANREEKFGGVMNLKNQNMLSFQTAL